MAPSLPLLPSELLVFVKENPKRKKTLKAIILNNFVMFVLNIKTNDLANLKLET